MLNRYKRSTGLVIGVAAVTVALGANAFTASNTVGASKAGAGAGAITGYAVSNIAYTNTAGSVTGVTFNLDAAAANVKVTLDSTGGTEYDCGASGASTPWLVTCASLNVPAVDADSLRVVANQ